MLRATCLWALLLVCCGAQAGGFAVVPLRAELGKNRTSSLTVTNTEDAKTFEVRAVSWKQQNRADSLRADRRSAPCAGNIPTGERGVAGRAHPAQQTARRAEHAYRVFVDEVPAAKEIRPNSLKTVVSMAIPVFVAPASGPIAKGQAALKASLAKDVISIELQQYRQGQSQAAGMGVELRQGRRTAQGAFGGLRADRQYADGKLPAEDPG
jgi:P pilus assembly chaperone PapD